MRSWVMFSIANELAPLSCKSTFQKALSADIAALEADALLGALLLEATVTEAPAREVLHARLEKLKGVLDAHRRVGECLEVGDAWSFHWKAESWTVCDAPYSITLPHVTRGVLLSSASA